MGGGNLAPNWWAIFFGFSSYSTEEHEQGDVAILI